MTDTEEQPLDVREITARKLADIYTASWDNLSDRGRSTLLADADAVLAAVTPVIRRQALAEAADDLDAEAARVRAEEWPVKVGAEYVYGIEHAAAFVENMAPRSHSTQPTEEETNA